MKDLSKIKKVCSFYVSDVHLITMMLPYLNREMNKGTEIILFTENNLEQNLNIILDKINIKAEEKINIKEINWKSYNKIKYSEIEDKIKIKDNNNINILINGNNKYIDGLNKMIEKVLKNNNIQSKITIINCYEVMQFNSNIEKILDKHDMILNTSGEKEISEVFEGYKRKMA